MVNAELEPGHVLQGRYRIAGSIGRGGMGTVYRAHDLELTRDVALKVLLVEPAARPDLAARFAREARALALLAHDNIVRIFDRFVTDGLPYVVMELLDGRTLESVLARGALDVSTAVGTALQIGEALATAHSHGVIHRDVKPSNVYIVGGSPLGRVKLLDFGLAKMAMDAHSLTAPDDVFGTLQYMAPEQVKSSKSAGAPADVYALGAVMYEMLDGAPPLDADGRLGLYFKVLHDPAPALRSRQPHVPPALAALVDACLVKDPARRPRIAHAVETLRALALAVSPATSVRVLPAPARVGDAHGGTMFPSGEHGGTMCPPGASTVPVTR